MPSFVEVQLADSNGDTGKLRIPITAQALPAGVKTYTDAVLAAAVGAGFLSLAQIVSASLVIGGACTPAAIAGVCDIRNKWQASVIDTSGALFKFGIPARNASSNLVVAGTKIVGDISLDAFGTVLSALISTVGTIHMINPRTGDTVSTWQPVLATTRSRKRPRVGGSR